MGRAFRRAATVRPSGDPAALRLDPLRQAERVVPFSAGAAPEAARITATLRDIRRLIDQEPDALAVLEEDAGTFYSRRFGRTTGPFHQPGGTFVMGEVLPPVPLAFAAAERRGAPYQSIDAPAAPAAALATVEPARGVPAQLRLRDVLAGWRYWVLWKMQAPDPARPSPVAPSDPAPDPAPSPEPATARPAEPVPPEDADLSLPEAPPVTVAPDEATLEQLVTRAAARLIDEPDLNARLIELIRDELHGEMGVRFSSNLRAVIRREIAAALDERLDDL